MLSRATLNHRPSSRQLLARVLEAPDLAGQVRALPGALLGKLIDHVGLEDAGELVALATTQQLTDIFDETLWHSARPGEDERFDSERFLLWLEILLESGERVLAQQLAELPQDLLTLALQRHLLVVRLVDLERELSGDDADAFGAEKALESSLSEELDDFQVIWRGGDGWDTVLAALLALDRDHHGLVVDVLERCADLSNEQIEDGGGLQAVLSGEEMLQGDLAAERETRRAADGYVAPSSAAAFLRLAKQGPGGTGPTERDALTKAYFRDLERGQGRSPAMAEAPAARPPLELARLLDAAGITEPVAPAQLPAHQRGRAIAPLLARALEELAERDPTAASARAEELAYLANVLLAAAGHDGERLRPAEAVEQALAGVRVGLSLVCPQRGAERVERAAQVLAQQGCDQLWRLGFGRALEPGLERRAGVDLPALRELKALHKRLQV
jgi:hypothetical protein